MKDMFGLSTAMFCYMCLYMNILSTNDVFFWIDL